MYISKMTKNVILIELSSVIWGFMRENFNTVVSKIGTEKGIYYHGEILREVSKKDSAAAKAIMAEHLSATTKGFFQDKV
jgi:DNA-binding FadR family transcriptional regulator